MSSIKKNFIYSSILTVSSYLFPLLTFPYVTRVLGVEYIGICNFMDSIIHYFIIFSAFGISTVGIREVAKSKGDSAKCSKVFSSLLLLNLLTTLFAIVLLLICTDTVPKLQEHKEMMYIGVAKLLANTLLVEWLYKGMENFRYITVRSIIVRSIYVVCVFIFVQNQSDYVTYFLLTTLMIVINAIINIFHSKKVVKISFKDISFRPYLKPFFTLGIYQFLTSMYISFNVMYLGFTCGDVQVGLYTTATKLYSIIIAFFTAFTGVMLPRMSSLVAESKIDEFKSLSKKSIDALLAFVFPLIIIAEVFAPQIINIVAGNDYEGAILPMRIVMPLMLIIGYEQIIIIQILSPLRKDKAILINSIVGATLSILLNILLVKHLGAVGSAIVWVACEIAVLCSAQFFVNKYIGYNFPFKKVLYRVLISIPIIYLLHIVQNYFEGLVLPLFIGSIISISLFIMAEVYFLKNKLIIENLQRIKKK